MWPVLLRTWQTRQASSISHRPCSLITNPRHSSVLYANNGMAEEISLDLDHLIQWTRDLLTRPERIKKDRITRKVFSRVLTTRKTRSRLVFDVTMAIALFDEITNESIQLQSNLQKDIDAENPSSKNHSPGVDLHREDISPEDTLPAHPEFILGQELRCLLIEGEVKLTGTNPQRTTFIPNGGGWHR